MASGHEYDNAFDSTGFDRSPREGHQGRRAGQTQRRGIGAYLSLSLSDLESKNFICATKPALMPCAGLRSTGAGTGAGTGAVMLPIRPISSAACSAG